MRFGEVCFITYNYRASIDYFEKAINMILSIPANLMSSKLKRIQMELYIWKLTILYMMYLDK